MMRWAAIACFVIAAAGAAYVAWTFTSDGSTDRDRVVDACIDLHESSLVVAERHEFSDVDVDHEPGDSMWQVSATMTGPNQFGVRTRTRIGCTVQQLTDGSFQASFD